MSLVEISRALSDDVSGMAFAPPVAFVYNPLDYARRPHEAYLERFGRGTKDALFLGMNPGPYGMAQTGVPFGEIASVRDWMGIVEPVKRPDPEHPKRPIQGFDCPRSEVSGRRLWGWVADRFGAADDFFARFFVHNYCPLVFMEETGRNRTPDKLPAQERDALFERCDEALRQVIQQLGVEVVIGVGAFAEKRAQLATDGSIRTERLLHPSPASPAANRGWAEQADRAMAGWTI
ncbi:MAG: uracil-DNA glycosylase family protein [Gemmatimonadota bacterium]